MICYVCHCTPEVPHEHHPELQAYGGTDKGTVILCSNCHNSLHKEISRLHALYKKGKGGEGVRWNTARHSQEVENAKNLVLCGLKSIVMFEGQKKTKVNISVDQQTHQTITALKGKLGASNIQDTILHCIKYTAKVHGLG
jgi:hypothetical protein